MSTRRHYPPALDLPIWMLYELFDWVSKKLVELYGGIDYDSDQRKKSDVDEMLRLFAANFDIGAMYRFLKWAQQQQAQRAGGAKEDQFSDRWILMTIMHDLRGCEARARFFDPRTSGY